MKKILLLAQIALIMTVNAFAAGKDPVRTAYIEKYKDIAIRQMNLSGIPASIILAQACLESGNGTSRLAVKGNNHFGIKCADWDGPRMYKNDDRRNECFRKYRTAEESFKDHSAFLTGRERYAFLFDIPKSDYKGWARGLKAAGYATNPKYPELLIKIIEDYELYRYDEGKPQNKGTVKERYRVGKNTGEDTLAARSTFGKTAVDEHYLYGKCLDYTLYRNNGRLFIVAQKGDTYRSIAKKYRMFRCELLSFNDLKKEVPIEEGDIVYLQKKKAKGPKGTSLHRIGKGESMHSISQYYGIRLRKLYRMNRISFGDEPEAGTAIRVR